MNSHHDILREIDAYAKAHGIDPSAVCRRATGNPRLHERLINRIERLETDVERLRKFMADHPPVSSGSGLLACANNVDPAPDDYKGSAGKVSPQEGAQ